MLRTTHAQKYLHKSWGFQVSDYSTQVKHRNKKRCIEKGKKGRSKPAKTSAEKDTCPMGDGEWSDHRTSLGTRISPSQHHVNSHGPRWPLQALMNPGPQLILIPASSFSRRWLPWHQDTRVLQQLKAPSWTWCQPAPMSQATPRLPASIHKSRILAHSSTGWLHGTELLGSSCQPKIPVHTGTGWILWHQPPDRFPQPWEVSMAPGSQSAPWTLGPGGYHDSGLGPIPDWLPWIQAFESPQHQAVSHRTRLLACPSTKRNSTTQ